MNGTPATLVSAIITTRNRASILPRAIESVLDQTYAEIEIIIVDDGSNDETEKVVRRYMEECPRIRYLKNNKPSGACAARNYGIREATGEFVAGLDDDDEWLPQRVEILLRDFRDDYAYVCSRDRIICSDREERRKNLPVITHKDMLYKNVTGNQILTRRERILSVGGYDEDLTSGQDYDLWLRLLEKYGNARMVPQPLQKVYRNHPGERVSISRDKIKGEWRLYKKHKAKMTRSQRRVHLVELKRLKGRCLGLGEVLGLFNTGYFLSYLKYYLRKQIRWGRVHGD